MLGSEMEGDDEADEEEVDEVEEADEVEEEEDDEEEEDNDDGNDETEPSAESDRYLRVVVSGMQSLRSATASRRRCSTIHGTRIDDRDTDEDNVEDVAAAAE